MASATLRATFTLTRRSRASPDCSTLLPVCVPRQAPENKRTAAIVAAITVTVLCVGAASFSVGPKTPTMSLHIETLGESETSVKMDRALSEASSTSSSAAEEERAETQSPQAAGAEASPLCQDMVSRCQEWAKQGECKRNTLFMHRECAASCGRCASGARPDISAAPKLPHEPSSPRCTTWARRGECDKNPVYMAQNCGEACAAAAKTADTKERDP
jgi:hypothetical protein